ncbi:Nitrosoguanidine resistance protein SNG1 [Colletotrichum sp. SAR 10_86]|nr:Nitrosoguanidine resistance protein SNG1 [Colletotrichum sp. SAR 10_75]KAI8236566.1 Nitrosoguanidine resistance protein SNG1 [Colletotrichum sp. SAR 10_86]KAI8264796.1 Nitrosoguanidine resistance protein SNG1 [Colletotrichum sp. SAR 10_77]
MAGSPEDQQRSPSSQTEVDHAKADETTRNVENGFAKLHEKPHHAVGFWDPSMRKVRAHVIRLWLQTIAILFAFILAVLSLYWAVLFRTEANLRSVVVHVVNFDGQVAPYESVQPIVGPTVIQTIQKALDSEGPSLGWTILQPSDFNNDPTAVRMAVYDFKAWAAVIVHANATAALQEAAATGDANYDPAGSLQIITQTARDSTTYQSDIQPYITQFTEQFSQAFGKQWGQTVMSNDSLSRENLARAPAVVNPGVAPLMIDIRPFRPATATPAVSIGLIYLIIMAFFSFSFFLPIHMKYIQPQGHPPLKFWQLIVWRWIATVFAYFLISLAYSLISLAFQLPFGAPPYSPTEPPPQSGATAYGSGTFPVYWMLNFAGMTALGLACENVAMIVGQPWTALWLIFWVITNVSTSFYALDLSPGFYSWGYAWPLHHVVEASRQLMFDLHSRIGLNFGVLFAWAAVNTVFFPFCCYFMRWKTEHDKRKAERDKDRYVVETAEGTEKEVRKPEENMPADFDKQSYWGERFASEVTFEWLTQSATFMSIVDPYLAKLEDAAPILQLGFGTSDLQNHFRQRGFQNVTNVDFEPRAIDRGRMLEKQVFGDVKMRYQVADVTQLQLPDKYDLIVDKSTVDAVSCGGIEPFLRMAEGVRRHLTDEGFWISLSYSFCRFDVEGLPFDVEVIAKIPTPKLKPHDPDVFHYCYLLKPKDFR